MYEVKKFRGKWIVMKPNQTAGHLRQYDTQEIAQTVCDKLNELAKLFVLQ